jgi:DNA-nicking Smr family endonuclease
MKGPAIPAKRGRALTANEDRLWRAVMRDVRAYRPQGPVPIIAAEARTPALIAKPLHAPPVQPPQQGGTRPGLGTGVDGATARRLAQGRMSPDATLDLHGMTQDHAHTALERFLSVSVAHGRRCVLVITGKGGPSSARPGDEAPWAQRHPGVLRSLVPLWLEHSASRGHIAALKSAHVKHGGSGAIYVYLRSK